MATLLPGLRRMLGLCERFLMLVTYARLMLAALLLAVKAAQHPCS